MGCNATWPLFSKQVESIALALVLVSGCRELRCGFSPPTAGISAASLCMVVRFDFSLSLL